MKKLPVLPYVALVEPLYPENVGFVARLVKNFNSLGLILVAPKADLNKAEKTAVHATDVLRDAVILERFEDLLRYPYLIGTTARVASSYNLHRSVVYPWAIPPLKPRKTVIVFGREDTGLRNQELEKCELIVNIPASDSYGVMNLSHAVAVLLYELYSRRLRKQVFPFEPAEKELYDAIYRKLKTVVSLLEYPPGKDVVAYLNLRRVFGKAVMTRREAFGVLGVLSRIIKKLKEPSR